jgi:hypothetical protein
MEAPVPPPLDLPGRGTPHPTCSHVDRRLPARPDLLDPKSAGAGKIYLESDRFVDAAARPVLVAQPHPDLMDPGPEPPDGKIQSPFDLPAKFMVHVETVRMDAHLHGLYLLRWGRHGRPESR